MLAIEISRNGKLFNNVRSNKLPSGDKSARSLCVINKKKMTKRAVSVQRPPYFTFWWRNGKSENSFNLFKTRFWAFEAFKVFIQIYFIEKRNNTFHINNTFQYWCTWDGPPILHQNQGKNFFYDFQEGMQCRLFKWFQWKLKRESIT